jgi:biotin-(acetyl-CoA carboxylase) ligase
MLVEYNSILYGIDKKVKLKKDNIIFETIIKGVSVEGQLITADAMERRFNFDEVQWVL